MDVFGRPIDVERFWTPIDVSDRANRWVSSGGSGGLPPVDSRSRLDRADRWVSLRLSSVILYMKFGRATLGRSDSWNDVVDWLMRLYN
jgi:hypothetical protein